MKPVAKQKPVVTYREAHVAPKVGGWAMLAGIKGHPAQARIDDEAAHTSHILRVERDAQGRVLEFETRNTIYRPEAT